VQLLGYSCCFAAAERIWVGISSKWVTSGWGLLSFFVRRIGRTAPWARPFSGNSDFGCTGTVVEVTSVVARVSLNMTLLFFLGALQFVDSKSTTALRNPAFCSALYARLLKYVFFKTHCSLSNGNRLVSTPGEKISISNSCRFAYDLSCLVKYGWIAMSGWAVTMKLSVLLSDQPNFSIR